MLIEEHQRKKPEVGNGHWRLVVLRNNLLRNERLIDELHRTRSISQENIEQDERVKKKDCLLVRSCMPFEPLRLQLDALEYIWSLKTQVVGRMKGREKQRIEQNTWRGRYKPFFGKESLLESNRTM